MAEQEYSHDPEGSGTWQRTRRAYRLYAWFGRYRWFRWLWSLFPSAAEMTVGVGSAAIVAAVAGATIVDAVHSRAKIEAAQHRARVRSEPNSTVYAISGADAFGRRVAFDLVVLDKSFDWVRASASALSSGDGRVLEGPDVARAVFAEKVRDEIAAAPHVIAVGAASQEGDAATELRRADQRARQTATWITPLAASSTTIWTLNLGQYSQPCRECETSATSWQRPFIVIVARPLDSDANLRQALLNAMTGRRNLPSPGAYSAFEFTRFR